MTSTHSIPQRPASSTKKINKQMMERKRRAKINRCLEQIKEYVLTATDRDPSEYDKLEKADILEMTVAFLVERQKARGGLPPSFLESRRVKTESENESEEENSVWRPW